MRDYAKTWTDYKGRVWPSVQSARRLKFKYPAHAALRAHVFHRDGYRCIRCGAEAIAVPADYDGSETLATGVVSNGRRVALVADHILTLAAGGESVVENMQTLCDICNRKKQSEDRVAIREAKKGAF